MYCDGLCNSRSVQPRRNLELRVVSLWRSRAQYSSRFLQIEYKKRVPMGGVNRTGQTFAHRSIPVNTDNKNLFIDRVLLGICERRRHWQQIE